MNVCAVEDLDKRVLDSAKYADLSSYHECKAKPYLLDSQVLRLIFVVWPASLIKLVTKSKM